MTTPQTQVIKTGNTSLANGNGDQKTFNTLTLLLAGFSTLMSLGFAFYTLANPKGDVLLIRQESREDLHREVNRLDSEILRFKDLSVAKFLTLAEHKEFVQRADKSADNLRDELNRIRSDQVTRSEHIQHWAEIASRIDAVRDLNNQLRRENLDSLTELRKELGGQYTLGDQLKNLQDQIKNLSTRIDVVNKMSKPAIVTTP